MTSELSVVACMSDEEWDTFVAPVQELFAGFAIERLRREDGVDGIVAALARTRAPVLLTAWSVPKLPEDLLVRAPGLKYLCHLCGTIRGFVPRALVERGLVVTNWLDTHAFTVAEHALLLALACLRRLGEARDAIRGGGFHHPPGPHPRTLRGKRVGLHGFGAVAKEFVRLVEPFSCRLSAFAPGDADLELSKRGVARAHTVEELFAGSDVLICVAPLNERTRGCVDAQLIARLPQDAVFVNVGRGGVCDEAALAAAVAAGRISVGLDVYVEEPLPAASPLRTLPRTNLTPHIGGPTVDQRPECGRLAAGNLRAFARGWPLRGIVDLARYDTIT